jgi:magnesium transporter
VIDAEDRLVGIVTHDDAADILRQEQGEDFLRFGGVAAEAESTDSPYWSMPVTSSVKRRIGWLFLLFGAGTLTGAVIRAFNWVDHRYPSIDFDAFIPLLIGTGGNAGSQAVGTVIRSIALNEIQFRDLPRVLLKEALTGLLLGSLLGAVGYFLTTLVMGHSSEFGAVIALAVLGICVWANCVGALVPLFASRFGIDPAVVSAPLISTLVDATGLVIFYSVSIALLARFST